MTSNRTRTNGSARLIVLREKAALTVVRIARTTKNKIEYLMNSIKVFITVLNSEPRSSDDNKDINSLDVDKVLKAFSIGNRVMNYT